MINHNEYQKIVDETNRCIKNGWDHSRVAWREMALGIICRLCLDNQTITANDFTKEILRNPIKTHDNRSLGGLIKVAQRLGWVEKTGDVEISKAGHLTRVQVWRSLIYGQRQQVAQTEPAKIEQTKMFDLPSNTKHKSYF